MLDDLFSTATRRSLRDTVRTFVEKEVAPHLADWEARGEVPRELHRRAGELGLLGVGFPEQHGGSGGDIVDKTVLWEELMEAGGSSGLMIALLGHEIAVPHILASGDRDLIEQWVGPTLAGDLIGALGVTEPGAGSDVANLRTSAEMVDGRLRINGSKTFISSGHRADFVTTAVRTGGRGHAGISLVVIDTTAEGLTRGRRLDKMGWRCSDTAELFLDDVAVDASQVVGSPGTGFGQLMANFQSERLWLAVTAYSTARRCIALAESAVREREAFGSRLVDRQVVQHLLVEMVQRTELARTFTRNVIADYARGRTSSDLDGRVSMAKNASTSACTFVVEQAVRLHGGMGFMRESEVERHYRDAPVLAIGGGAKEVMTDLAAKRLGLTRGSS